MSKDIISDTFLPIHIIKNKAEPWQTKHELNPHYTYEINEDNLVFGNLLGQGSFCDVHEVAVEYLNDDQSQDMNPRFPYAVKRLCPQNKTDPERLKVGVTDLVRECKILARLSHENIISLYGATDECLSDVITPSASGNYSLVLERLESTLEKQIPIWRDREKLIRDEDDERLIPFNRQTTFPRRKDVALQIARALVHIHKIGIMYRDLKPENIGFDSQGVVKVFDFGLAKSIVLSKNGEKERSHTAMTGSLRYMAPEVAFGQNYGPKADVYSFGILLWQLFFLQTPFSQYDESITFIQGVFIQRERPFIYKNISAAIQRLMICCWSSKEKIRPTFLHIVRMFEKGVNHIPRWDIFRHGVKPKKKCHLKKLHQTDSDVTHASTVSKTESELDSSSHDFIIKDSFFCGISSALNMMPPCS